LAKSAANTSALSAGSFDFIARGKIRTILIVPNPDKLRHV
jgi:hypothetical protein